MANSPTEQFDLPIFCASKISFKDSPLVAILYCIFFTALIWPICPLSSESWIGHSGDELQASWNMWWFRHAIFSDLTSPWFTHYIHFPLGISLLGQPLAAPHGLFYLILAPFISLAAAYNLIALSGFVLSGLFAYWIARDLRCSRRSAFLAGYLVTFSNFHFQHLHGHLEFVSMQWLLLFLFSFQRLVYQQSLGAAALSVLSLFLVAVGNSYYLLTAVLGACCLIYPALCRIIHQAGTTRYGIWLSALAGAAATTGVYVYNFVATLRDSPLLPGHSLELGSLHPSLVFIPSQFWRWGYITEPLWEKLPRYTFEHSVALGFGICALVIIGVQLRLMKSPALKPWAAFFCLSLFLAIGPRLYVGSSWIDLPLPYDALDLFLPFSALSGVPVRLFSGASIAAAILAGLAFERLIGSKKKWQKLLAIILAAFAIFEQIPRVPDLNRWKAPAYAQAIGQLPRIHGSAVVDLVSKGGDQLMAQTIHGYPILFGYSARISKKVDRQNRQFRKLLSSGQFEKLCSLVPIAYLVAPPDRFPGIFPPELTPYKDSNSHIYTPCPPPGAWQQGIDTSWLK